VILKRKGRASSRGGAARLLRGRGLNCLTIITVRFRHRDTRKRLIADSVCQRRPYAVGMPLLSSWETAVTSWAGADCARALLGRERIRRRLRIATSLQCLPACPFDLLGAAEAAACPDGNESPAERAGSSTSHPRRIHVRAPREMVHHGLEYAGHAVDRESL
jgi:hypothetical protein